MVFSGYLLFPRQKSQTRLSNWTELNWRRYCKVIHEGVQRKLSPLFYYFLWAIKTNSSSLSYLFILLLYSSTPPVCAPPCPTLCHPRDWSPPGSSAHGTSRARVLKWVAVSFPRVSPQPRDWTRVSCASALQADSLLLNCKQLQMRILR